MVKKYYKCSRGHLPPEIYVFSQMTQFGLPFQDEKVKTSFKLGFEDFSIQDSLFQGVPTVFFHQSRFVVDTLVTLISCILPPTYKTRKSKKHLDLFVCLENFGNQNSPRKNGHPWHPSPRCARPCDEVQGVKTQRVPSDWFSIALQDAEDLNKFTWLLHDFYHDLT